MYSENNKNKLLVVWSAIALITVLFSGIASAQSNGNGNGNGNSNGNGQPLEALQTQLDEQQAQIDQQQAQIEALLSATNNETEFDVNCHVGESINDVLDSVGGSGEEITINITGICSESVAIEHGNLRLIGNNSFSDGIQGSDTALQASFGSSIYAQSLSISSLSLVNVIGCSDGGTIHIADSEIESSSVNAVLAVNGGNCKITNTHLTGTASAPPSSAGARVLSGSTLLVEGSHFENFRTAIVGGANSVVRLLNDDLTASRLSDNVTGLRVTAGAFGFLGPDTSIDNNNVGVAAVSGSLLSIGPSLFVFNNSVVGLDFETGATILMPRLPISITGNGTAPTMAANSGDVWCDGSVVLSGMATYVDASTVVSTDCPEGMWVSPP